MASTFTDDLRIELMATGENNDTWGTKANTNVFELLEDALTQETSVSTTGGTTVLTANNGSADQARAVFLDVSGTLISNATIEIPAANKFYLVRNATTGAFTVTIKTSAGTGQAVTQGNTALVYCDATDTFRIGVEGDADLNGIAGLSTTGLISRTGAGTFATRTLTGPAAGITVTNGDGVSGNPTLALANDLSAVEGLASTGLATRTASDTWTARTVTGTANEVTVTNGDGVAGNPTLSLPTALTFTGKTVTGGTLTGITDIAVADGGTGASTAAGARTNLGVAASGAVGSSGLIQNTNRLLGRTTAAVGAVEEISVGAGLILASGSLAAVGGAEFISTADISNNAVVDFTGFDAAKYDAYIFILANVIPVTDGAVLSFRTSTDGGSVFDATSGDYVRQLLSRDSADAADVFNTDGSSTVTSVSLSGFTGIGTAVGEHGYSGHLTIYEPNRAVQTRFMYEGTYQDSDGNERVVYGSGRRSAAEDVNAIRFLASSGNLSTGLITMYGLRNA